MQRQLRQRLVHKYIAKEKPEFCIVTLVFLWCSYEQFPTYSCYYDFHSCYIYITTFPLKCQIIFDPFCGTGKLAREP